MKAGRHASILLAASWTCLAATSLWKLRAGSSALEPFNSDIAIPVLMTNDRRWDLFQCFYYGQDRYGAWPFLLLRLAGLAFQTVIGWEHLQGALIGWLLVGSLAFAALCRRVPSLSALLFLVALLANPDMRVVFNLHVYGWQLTTLLLAWWRLRAFADLEPGRSQIGAWWSRSLAFLCSALATWLSPLSGAILVVFGAVELARSRGLARPRPLGSVALDLALPVFAAIGFEGLLRKAYHRFALSQFGWDYHTSLRADWGRLGENAKMVARAILQFQWLSLQVLGTIAFCGALLLILKWRANPGKGRGSPAHRLFLEYAFVILGLGAGAMVQLPILIAVDHVRYNDFDSRYFTQIEFFGTLAGLLTVAGILDWALMRLKAGNSVLRATSAGGMLALAFLLPTPVEDPYYQRLKRTAAELAQRSPGAVLLSGYWDTYQVAALRPHSLTPVPFDGQYVRMPWNVAALRESREIIVGHQGSGEEPGPGLGPELNQYGMTFQLKVLDWYQDGERRYSRYRNKVANSPDAPLQ